MADVRLLGGRGGLNREAGDLVWAGNLDRDRCAEVLAVESDGTDARPGQVTLIEPPVGSALLSDYPSVVVQTEDQPTFGNAIGVLDGTLYLVADNGLEDNGYAALSFPLFTTAGDPLTVDDAVGILTFESPFLSISSMTLSRSLGGAPAVITGFTNSLERDRAWDGVAYVFDVPLEGILVGEEAARSWFYGNPGDNARTPYGEADLDGDGRTDLAIGAYGFEGYGRVGVLTDPPEGGHALWEVADATFEGDTYGGEFGLVLSSGDLDGDGSKDLIVGAPISTDGGATHVFRGPVATGGHAAADADWTVRGASASDFTGMSATAGDLDGDGTPDLAVGQPRNYYVTDEPGRVLLLQGPLPPGSYTEADAGVIVTNAVPPADADSFGRRVVAGDIDGDGADDLAIGALTDPDERGVEVGSVQLFFGGADLFP